MKNETVSKYTPGPWVLLHHTAAQHDGDRAVYGPGNKWICDMNGGPNDNDGTLANARLIASAPTILEHLKRLTNVVNNSKVSRADILNVSNDAMIIIAKAEGRI